MAGFILGFMMALSVPALIGGFAALSMYFKADHGYVGVGAATGVVMLLIAAIIAFKSIR